jgi:GntR family transcriptional repressor for pyruvate dehydrogenase complex
VTDDDLFDRLLSLVGEVGPDQRIPSERDLAEQWGCSRTALRDRLRKLEAMGALERKGAGGTYTRVMKPGDVAMVLQTGLHASALSSPAAFQSVRVALEREAARIAAIWGKPVPIAHVEEAVLRMESATHPDELYAADMDFHRALFQASGDAGLIFLSEAVGDLIARSVTERRARMQTLSSDAEVLRTLHRNILDALKSRSPTAAMQAMDEHFARVDRASELQALVLSRGVEPDNRLNPEGIGA